MTEGTLNALIITLPVTITSIGTIVLGLRQISANLAAKVDSVAVKVDANTVKMDANTVTTDETSRKVDENTATTNRTEQITSAINEKADVIHDLANSSFEKQRLALESMTKKYEDLQVHSNEKIESLQATLAEVLAKISREADEKKAQEEREKFKVS